MQSLFYDLGDSFRAFDLLTREMNRYLAPTAAPAARKAAARTDGRVPAFDTWESEAAFFLAAELPGVAKEDLSITLESGKLTIAARRELPAKEGYELRARERRAFAFERTFELPGPLAADKIEASLENGILKVTLPKAEEKKPLKIAIKTA